MKNRIALIMSVLLVLSSCVDTPLVESLNDVTALSTGDSTDIRNISSDIQYEIEIATFEDGPNISIEIPRLIAESDVQRLELINEKIESVIISNFINTWVWNEELSVESKVEIKMLTRDVLSFIVISEPAVFGSSPTRFVFGITIDLQLGHLMMLEDQITLSEINEALRTGEAEIIPEFLADELFPANGFKRISSPINQDSFGYYNFFLSEKGIHLLVGVAPADGDYAEIIISGRRDGSSV